MRSSVSGSKTASSTSLTRRCCRNGAARTTSVVISHLIICFVCRVGLLSTRATTTRSPTLIQMLFVAGDQARFAAAKELDHPPGSYWHYSGGASAIIAHILRATFATEGDYLRYPRERLFGPVGMKSAILEADASGTFAASSFLYATARDFARLGLLFLQDGMWEGNALLPDNWVVYSRGPARTSPDGSYGAHIWLRLPKIRRTRRSPDAEDAYYFLGYDEQIVAIVPFARSCHRTARSDAG